MRSLVLLITLIAVAAIAPAAAQAESAGTCNLELGGPNALRDRPGVDYAGAANCAGSLGGSTVGLRGGVAELLITGGREVDCTGDVLAGRLEIEAPRAISIFEPDFIRVIANVQMVRGPGGMVLSGSGFADGEPIRIAGGGMRPDEEGTACPAGRLRLDLAVLPLRGENVDQSQGATFSGSGQSSRRAQPRMRVTVSPRRPRAGRLTTFRFTTRTLSGRAVRGAGVRFAGLHATSNDDGVATIRKRVQRPGLVVARATADGHQSAARRVRVHRAR